ncbi:MAG: NAD(P)H-dependent oxidoreductase [Alphaproteobacteria bacterium]|nr:NAD(P)H-dependent oxidoreductase [Alphaproteobacteria bacterium]
MSQLKIAYIIGSIRQDSLNRKLVNALIKLAPKDVTFSEVAIRDLPLYSQDYDADFPPIVNQLKAAVTACDGVLFATPEYNRSIPGVLKNAIDFGSRPYGQSAWAGKPAGVIGASVGAAGSSMAQQHLRNILSHLNMPTLPLPEVFVHVKEGLFDDAGNFGASNVRFFQKWMDNYVAWVKLHKSA